MCIRICMQDEFVDLCSYRVIEAIGGLRGCKSSTPKQWGVFEPNSTPAKDKLSILVREGNLVQKNMKLGRILFKQNFIGQFFPHPDFLLDIFFTSSFHLR